MASQNLLMLLSLLCVMAVGVAGNEEIVGGERGWNIGADIAPVKINAGDSVKFFYSPTLHNVFEVSESDYWSCSFSSPLNTYYSGKDSVILNNPGTYYYICGVPEHCLNKMKVIVYVQPR